jgi:hypothetical protein
MTKKNKGYYSKELLINYVIIDGSTYNKIDKGVKVPFSKFLNDLDEIGLRIKEFDKYGFIEKGKQSKSRKKEKR